MAKRDPVVVRKIRWIILLGAFSIALIGLLAVTNVVALGRTNGFILLSIALFDAIFALVVFRDREA